MKGVRGERSRTVVSARVPRPNTGSPEVNKMILPFPLYYKQIVIFVKNTRGFQEENVAIGGRICGNLKVL